MADLSEWAKAFHRLLSLPDDVRTKYDLSSLRYVLISGGVNIYPAEVDAVLLEHAAVGDVAVIGIPDDEWGETVLAVVELRDGNDPTLELAEEMIEHCRAHLAQFKCPRRVEFTAVLPREDNGKIYKRHLREQFRNPTVERA
jgi:long-chain acyl-CoA synthetase